MIDRVQLDIPRSGDESAMDAAARGSTEGASLLINVVAMLTVLVALIHLASVLVGVLPDIDRQPLSLQRLLGWVMAPFRRALIRSRRSRKTYGHQNGAKRVFRLYRTGEA